MQEVRKRFTDRAAEVETFFNLMEHAHEPGAAIGSDARKEKWGLDSDSQRLLRASGFLVLYNLVEATISDGLNVILKTIEKEGVVYANAANSVQSLWLAQRIGKKTESSKIVEEARALVEDALRHAVVRIDRKTIMKGGGNIDTKRIREIAEIMGFERSAGAQAEKGNGSLDLVKQKRNSLAHGNFGFLEVGRDSSEKDMQRLKGEVVCYVDAVLQNMVHFVESRAYLKHRP